ncbi:hypothetical protein [Mucilaginibacter flavidus]|nr:hypothetical protein [Mucilaginibacter flavidus]MCO5945283.1 hypothetical protein [Mucilaginibacter flavidus]
MPSHIHLVFRSATEKPEDLIGGFKSYRSRKLINLLKKINRKAGANGC